MSVVTITADLTPEQRERQRARNARFRAAHPNYEREWRTANRARRREQQRAWRAANPDKERQYASRVYGDPKKRAERAIQNVKRWKEENPTRARAISVSAKANSRAADYGADGRLTPDNVIELWRRQPDCLSCGDGAGLDHIVPFCRGGSNTTGNIQNLCRSCNSRKGRRLPSEFVA